MPIFLSKGCCCLRLRTCAYILAWLRLVVAILETLLIAKLVTGAVLHLKEEVIKSQEKSNRLPWEGNLFSTESRSNETVECQKSAFEFQILVTIVLIDLIIHWILCTILFIGIYTKKPFILKTYCVVQVISILLFNAQKFHQALQTCTPKEDILYGLITWVLAIGLEIYCLLCVFSYYQELAESTKNRRTEIPMYAPAPQVPLVDPAYNPSPAHPVKS